MDAHANAALPLETVGKTEDAAAEAVAIRRRARGSAYGESEQERAMENQPHEHRPPGDDRGVVRGSRPPEYRKTVVPHSLPERTERNEKVA